MKQNEIEKKILDFWKKDNTFQKSLEKDAPKGDYVFYDGPPFATGTPHYGHIVASLMKDMIPRYFTMKGYRVDRRWGWDCHGLPIENIVEKEHGFKQKKDILEYGVDKFNEEARSKVLKYAREWQIIIERIGRWVDFENGYKTMDPNFMETVWWVFKRLYDKGLLYESYRSMHICPRCETTLAQSEVAQGYRDVKDISVIAKFKLKKKINESLLKRLTVLWLKNSPYNAGLADSEKQEREIFEMQNIYFLAWTTTPWTLPGNVALAIGKKITYAIVESDGEIFILAKDKVEKFFAEKDFLVLENIKSDDLKGMEYEPLFPYYDNDKLERRENGFKIYEADFVNTEEGTGIVHIAPAFGDDDYNLSKKENLPFIQHVGMDGAFKQEVTDFALKQVKPKDSPDSSDIEIIKYLAQKDLIFAKEKIEHSYPHCWRCDSPLLNYATSSWFVKVEEIKNNLLKNAKHINWMPSHIKEGRFGDWLAGARDWSISRQRFWGSVIPIWKCSNDPKHKKVIGSIKELEELSGAKVVDLHKHFVDKIVFKCSECVGEMRRIPDVLDCWFESGSMPYAQLHYPFENEKKFKNNFPAEFIAEGVDQARAWFYYLHVLSGALFEKHAYKNVIVNGIVLAEDGRKMSKSLQNYPDPMEIIEKHGADSIRYYLASSTVMRAEDFNFSEKGVDDVVKKVLLILHNVLAFYKMYAIGEISKSDSHKSDNVLDKYIIAKINIAVDEITKSYESYDLNGATRPIMPLINEVSTWYLRQSRDRFKDESCDYKKFALATLKYSLEMISKIIAPVMPFTAEYIWWEIGNSGSVHLQEWPKSEKIKNQSKIVSYMDYVKLIAESGNAKRKEIGIKIRQPLKKIIISTDRALDKEYENIIKQELNVKKVGYKKSEKFSGVNFDTKITDDLLLEGYFRELVRTINSMRKSAGLTPGDIVKLEYKTKSGELKKMFKLFEDDLKKSVIASDIVCCDNDGEEFDINGEMVSIKLVY